MYNEEDTPGPCKLLWQNQTDAEEAVMEYKYGWAIVCTCFVYGKSVLRAGTALLP